MSPLLRVYTAYVLGIVFLMASRSSPGSRPWDSSRRTHTVILWGVMTAFTMWATCAATVAHDWPCFGVALGGIPFRISCRISLIPASIRSSWVLAVSLYMALSSYRLWSTLTCRIAFSTARRILCRGLTSSSFVRLSLTSLRSFAISCQSWPGWLFCLSHCCPLAGCWVPPASRVLRCPRGGCVAPSFPMLTDGVQRSFMGWSSM